MHPINNDTPARTYAGWSSPVARQAHNLKVAGSNPAPATNPHHVRPGHMGNRSYRRHGLQPGAKRAVCGLQGLLLQIDEAEIVAHEADDPNAFVYLFDTQALPGENG